MGFDPVVHTAGDLALRNCPITPLSQRHSELVCGMNLSLMEGLLAGLRVKNVQAERAQEPGMCCVALRTKHGPDRANAQ